jgi:hypothetical protein
VFVILITTTKQQLIKHLDRFVNAFKIQTQKLINMVKAPFIPKALPEPELIVEPEPTLSISQKMKMIAWSGPQGFLHDEEADIPATLTSPPTYSEAKWIRHEIQSMRYRQDERYQEIIDILNQIKKSIVVTDNDSIKRIGAVKRGIEIAKEIDAAEREAAIKVDMQALGEEVAANG